MVICVSNQKPEDSDEIAIDIAKESDFKYDLEFIYTKNLALDYKVYELSRTEIPDNDEEKIPEDSIMIEGVDDFYWNKKMVTIDSQEKGTVKSLEWKDVSKARWQAVFNDMEEEAVKKIQNKGQYLLFQQDTNDIDLHLAYTYDTESKKPQYEYDYYLIEMSWKVNANFSDNAKETDLLYVVVNAKQPEPTTKTE